MMEKTNRKALREGIKGKYFDLISEFLKAQDEEVLQTGSAEFAIPVLDAEQNEDWLVVTLKCLRVAVRVMPMTAMQWQRTTA